MSITEEPRRNNIIFRRKDSMDLEVDKIERQLKIFDHITYSHITIYSNKNYPPGSHWAFQSRVLRISPLKTLSIMYDELTLLGEQTQTWLNF